MLVELEPMKSVLLLYWMQRKFHRLQIDASLKRFRYEACKQIVKKTILTILKLFTVVMNSLFKRK